MRNGRPASTPITNPLATTPPSLVTRRRCSSPGLSQGAHIISRSTLYLRTLCLCHMCLQCRGVGSQLEAGYHRGVVGGDVVIALSRIVRDGRETLPEVHVAVRLREPIAVFACRE